MIATGMKPSALVPFKLIQFKGNRKTIWQRISANLRRLWN